MLELKHISAGYGKTSVLEDVSVSIPKGKLTGIIGVNGCGKSTLLKAILGILPVTSGEIFLDGTDLSLLKRTQIAQNISYLAQGRNTPDMTVAQMVLHGRFPYLGYPRRYTDRDKEIALAAMDRVGISSLAGKPLYCLSGGLRQMAYIAMALAQDTDYILLDEPTTYLDISHQLALMNLMRELADEGKGIVAVAHDLPLVMRYSDAVLLLDNGRVAFSGSPDEVCQSNIITDTFGVGISKGALEGYYLHIEG